ncbi:MAG: sigma-70 family RNA polymerase sigma factor [Proteobacteria bacterium]|nr:sigma-70 family RNA polymerase sigma factor [Pseudomonadota bacterium]
MEHLEHMSDGSPSASGDRPNPTTAQPGIGAADGAGAGNGNSGTGISELVAQHYGALRSLAERQLAADRARTGFATLSPTSLLGETFTRLLRQETRIVNESHLSAIATMLFMRVLADRRRKRLATKRGGRNSKFPVDGLERESDERSPEEDALLAADVDFLHEKLAELAEREPRRAEAISLHTIGGMTIPMVAELLGVSVATVERDLALARAWLASQMK